MWEGEREGKLGSDKQIDVLKEVYTLGGHVFIVSQEGKHILHWLRRNDARLLSCVWRHRDEDLHVNNKA